MCNTKLFSLNGQQLENQYRENMVCLRMLDWQAFYVTQLCVWNKKVKRRAALFIQIFNRHVASLQNFELSPDLSFA